MLYSLTRRVGIGPKIVEEYQTVLSRLKGEGYLKCIVKPTDTDKMTTRLDSARSNFLLRSLVLLSIVLELMTEI